MNMSLTELLNTLPTSARLTHTPEFKLATGCMLVGFSLMAPARAQRMVDNFGYLDYGNKDAKREGNVISVYADDQWCPVFTVE
jgi:hypothetical protein